MSKQDRDFPALRIHVADGEIRRLLIRKQNRPGERLGPLAGAHIWVVRTDRAEVTEGVTSGLIRLVHGGSPRTVVVRGPTLAYLVFADYTTIWWQVSGVGGRATAEADEFNRMAGSEG